MRDGDLAAETPRQRVTRLVLEPMNELFAAPSHIAGDKAKMKKAFDAYIRMLEGFSERELCRAWEVVSVTHQRWTWPLPGQFVLAVKGRMDDGVN